MRYARSSLVLVLALFVAGCASVGSSGNVRDPTAKPVSAIGGPDIGYPVDSESYRTTTARNGRIRFLVLHYTVLDFAGSIKVLTEGGKASAHYLLPDLRDPSYQTAGFKHLRVFNLVDEPERAWHAGVSAWEDRTNLNDTSIGIEIVNQASEHDGQFMFAVYPPEQIDALAALIKDILARHPDITPTRVVAHSDIAYLRKSDPGPLFPWEDLYRRGIGIWYEQATVDKYLASFRMLLPPESQLQDEFRKFGYRVPAPMAEESYRLLVRAFQMRFRPSRYDGEVDAETAAILYALNERYRQ